DVFVHDRVTGVTERVSVSTGGYQAFNGSHASAISADGRFVAFESLADLTFDSRGPTTEIYVRDRLTGTTERVSLSYSGIRSESTRSRYAAISGDGRFVGFSSALPNLVPGDTNGRGDI